MNVIFRGKLRRLEFTFAHGDLFNADVETIVNSEQSDFVLALNPDSTSGQIRRRYGQTVQDELDAATKGQVLRAGTIISTSGGSDWRQIFHVGFHDPDDWPGVPGSSSHADYLEAIGSCIDQVLHTAVVGGIQSVAFPLIGCGLFGLDEKMLVLQFLDAIENLDRQLGRSDNLHVWLVIRERKQFDSIVSVLLGLLLDYRNRTMSLRIEPTGVSLVDRFAAKLAHRSEEDWMKWQLCRLAEIALEIMCYSLCRAADPAPTPETLFEEGMAATFGTVREHALRLAAGDLHRFKKTWGRDFFSAVLRKDSAAEALEAINSQRNNLAHGRKTLSMGKIEDLVRRGLQLGGWAKILETDGNLDLAAWLPWVSASTDTDRRTGLFERWQKNAIRYLVPETGEVFKVFRQTSVNAGSSHSAA